MSSRAERGTLVFARGENIAAPHTNQDPSLQ